MKTLLVLACILALVVPFQASSSGSHSKERRHFRPNRRPPSRPWPMQPHYPYYPNSYYPFRYPTAPGGPFRYYMQPGSPYMYILYVPQALATATTAGTTTTTTPATTTTTTPATTTTTTPATTTTASNTTTTMKSTG